MQRRRRPPRAGALSDLPPLKIIRTIILLQVAYYICATVLVVFTTLVAGTPFSVDLILSWRSIRGDNTVGWTLGVVWLLNSLIGVIFLLLLVSRSKLVPDFSVTIHFLHLIITSIYSHSIPTNLLWWGLQASSAALMTSIGVWACQYRELRPIKFGGGASRQPGQDNSGGDEESQNYVAGFAMGRGRGRNRDGGGNYEMVGMKEGEEQA